METENDVPMPKPDSLQSDTTAGNAERFLQFEATLADARDALVRHPVFGRVHNISAMRCFMETHVFAVWDFMSLLKTLQTQLTTTRIPWLPPANRDAARLINEIVVGEESDEVAPGQYISHFELYLEAMCECGASTLAMDSFVAHLARGASVEEGLGSVVVMPHVRAFVRSTMKFCALRPHQVAAAFLYGREDIIPEMFERLLSETEITHQIGFRRLKLYLERHIELDGGSHGPMAKKLMQTLCADDSVKWQEAAAVAHQALTARQELWDAVLERVIV